MDYMLWGSWTMNNGFISPSIASKHQEVIDKTIPYGCKCDCWSLGVMLCFGCKEAGKGEIRHGMFANIVRGVVDVGPRYIIMTDEHPCCPDAHKMETPTLFGTRRVTRWVV